MLIEAWNEGVGGVGEAVPKGVHPDVFPPVRRGSSGEKLALVATQRVAYDIKIKLGFRRFFRHFAFMSGRSTFKLSCLR